MVDPTPTIVSALADYFEMVRQKVHQWVAPIGEEQGQLIYLSKAAGQLGPDQVD